MIPEEIVLLAMCILYYKAVLYVGGLLVWLLAYFFSRDFTVKIDEFQHNIYWLAGIYCIFGAFFLYPLGQNLEGQWSQPLATFFESFLLLLTGLHLGVAYQWREKLGAEFPLVVLVALFVMLLLLNARNLLVIFLLIEILSLISYALVAWRGMTLYSLEAALKYFSWGSFASLAMLLSISLFYFHLGSLELGQIPSLLVGHQEPFYGYLLALLYGAFFFKLAVFPFHYWLPQIYQGADRVITLYLAVVSKVPLFYVFAVIHGAFGPYMSGHSDLLLVAFLLSALVGALGALYQETFAGFLAYSAVNNGSMVLLLLVQGEPLAAAPALHFLAFYALHVLVIFGALMFFATSQERVLFVTHFEAFYHSNPALAVIVMVTLASMAGIPPLGGFWAKVLLLIYFFLFEGSFFIAMLLLITIISGLYYFRLIRFLWYPSTLLSFSTSFPPKGRHRWWQLGVFFVLLSVVLLYPLLIDPLFIALVKALLVFYS